MKDIGANTIKMGLKFAKLDPTFGYGFSLNPYRIKGLQETEAQIVARRQMKAEELRVDALSKVFNAPTIPELRTKIHERIDEEKAETKESNKQEQNNIKKGVQSALGGPSLKILAKVFGFKYGTEQLIRLGKFLAFENALRTSQVAQQFNMSALATGASTQDVSSMALASMAFGGGLKTSANFFAKINKLLQGAIMGKGLGEWGEAAKLYGLNLTGSGKGGLATQEELIERISNRLRLFTDPRELADFISTLGIDSASFMLLKDGYERYKERIKYAEEGSPFAVVPEQMSELAESTGILRSEFEKLSANFANTDYVKSFVDAAVNVLHETNKQMSEGALIQKLYEESGRDEDKFLSLLKEHNIDYIGSPIAAGLLHGSHEVYESSKEAQRLLQEDRERRIKSIEETREKLNNVSKDIDNTIEEIRALFYDDQGEDRRLNLIPGEMNISPDNVNLNISPSINISGNVTLKERAKNNIEDIIKDSSSWASIDSVIQVQ